MEVQQYRMSLLDRVKHFGVRKVLKKCALGRWIYPVIQKLYRLYAIPMKRRRLQKHGPDCMRRLHQFFVDHNVDYYCDSGTLLGFVRDHGFIKSDDDIDIAIVEGAIEPKKLVKYFLDAGYGLIHAFRYESRIIMFTVADVTQITIDVYFQTLQKGSTNILDAWSVCWRPESQYPSEKANSAVSYHFLKPDGFKDIEVQGVTVRVPANTDDVLESEYPNWRVPDPNYKHEQGFPHTDWPGFCYRLTAEEVLEG